jgi:putative nucleotidyltransferase with HDIG domain
MAKHRDLGARMFRPETLRWIVLVSLSLIMSFILFPNILNRPIIYELGDVAEKDIKASSDILIENEELTEKAREKVVKDIPYIYDFDPSASDLTFRFKEVMAEARDVYNRSGKDDSTVMSDEKSLPDITEERELVKGRFFKVLEIAPDETMFKKLIKNRFSVALEEAVIGLVSQVFNNGVVGNKEVLMSHAQKGIILQGLHSQEESVIADMNRFYDIEEAKAFIKSQRSILSKEIQSPEQVDLIIKMAISLIKPNVTFNKRETEVRKEEAQESVKPSYYKIKKGEMLVREGERIEPEHILKLTAEAESAGQPDILSRVPGMAVMLGFLFATIYLAGLIKYKPSHRDIRDLFFNALTLLTLFIFIWAYSFVGEEISRGFHFLNQKTLMYGMPVACGAMLVAIFHGIGIAATFSLIISVLASLIIEGQVEFFVYFFISSLTAAYGVREYHERGVLIKTGVKVGLVNMVLCLSIETIYGSLYSMEAVVAVTASFIGGILVGVISTGIVPLIEMAFGFTTDIKLLELANLDQPLLRELMVQSPGTYHHSVIVSNMVEATAKAIQANPLLAKVSAYYHDIGKMKKPLYFIENQGGGENKHEKLAPSMSSLVLISHVKDGVELARDFKLGWEIIDIIQQHHGKSLITYFYQKAKEHAFTKGSRTAQVKEEDFRYPGPKPQTKEAGLVMLADMIEAATRSLADPTPARIQGIVQKMINQAFSDGQLDECELTLKDLHEIAKSFNKTLSGIFHQRIEYPETNIKPAKRAANGDSGQFSTAEFRNKQAEGKTSNKNGLKRLGL